MSENKRQIQKRETRSKLIEIAMIEFSLNGILSTRTIDIAKAAKVSHGTVFSHFPTQEELLIAVINEFGNKITTRLHELVSEESTLADLLKAHITGLTEFEDFYTRLIIERRLLPEEVRNVYISINSTISHHISLAAEREASLGNIRPLSIDLLYNTWIGLLHYYLTNSDLFSPNQSVLKNYGSQLVDHYIKLIKI
ncbi:TetR/AcrR family transcriptional regulator [Clostridium folliculivorans]|uniref:TetR family transcriptional regulator n=1 Tax=Clostridium folliculivorans TaxID=2886038 RepID=A0A9W5Y464_9CLOT|nr:TetR/AcrR family transcriptional regulator [Clostridium folliculivorans]GKU26321.1 TetR family transcriptional regulator [Clostridium folliculivorans]GKU32124.1 TetR family transcriptional regulator [Clostridium folliculivorans]